MNAGAATRPRRLWRAPLGSPVAAGLSGKVAESLSQLLLVSLVPAVLGPADYGTFAVALSLVSIATAYVTVGGPTLLTRFVPTAAPPERAAVARALAARIARWRALQVVLIASVAGVLMVSAPGRFEAPSTVLVVAAIGLDVAATLTFQIALALGRAHVWSFRYSLQNCVLIAVALVLYEVAGANGAVGGIAVASGASLVVGLAAVAGPIRAAHRGAAVPSGAMRFGFLQGASGLLTQLQYRGGVVAVGLLGGSRTQAGFAALAAGVALTPINTMRQTFTVQLPALAERASQSLTAAEAVGRRLTRRWELALVPIALGAALSFDTLLPAVVGESFKGADEALAPALALLPLAPITALLSQLSALRLQPGVRLRATVVGTAAFVATVALAVPAWGAAGATTGLLVGMVATVLAAARALPGLLDRELAVISFGGAALVLAAGLYL
jgi:O-antigen/teichoic acid export membrane protein